MAATLCSACRPEGQLGRNGPTAEALMFEGSKLTQGCEMRKMLGILATAGLLILGTGAASAQGVNVQIGEGGVRVTRDRAPMMERREMRRDMRRDMRRGPVRTVCRTEIRRTVRSNGVVVRRPVEVCRRIYR
jgi:hypothetical protein